MSGEFRILREIDKGSMGVVYLADTAEWGQVAVKTFSVSDAGNEKEWELLRKLLVKEGRRTMELDHPNIVRVYDVVDDEEMTYIVMEFIDGLNLDRFLANNPGLEHGQILSLLKQAASALDYAAQKGLVHRDIKPANILLAAEGAELKITDFGIAKRVSDYASAASASSSASSLSETHRVGTLRYMAPEQITEPQSVNSRADQYSLANIAYLLLTGRGVFHEKTSETSLGFAIVNTAPPKPSQFADGLRRVDKVMKRALAKKPEDRFTNCTAFVAAIEEALFSKPVGIPMWAKAAVAGVVLVVGLGFGLSYLNRANDSPVPENKPQITSKDIQSPGQTQSPDVGKSDPGESDAKPSEAVAPPPPPRPVEPTFGLALSANNKLLAPGFSFAKGDNTYGDLGKGDLVANVSASGGRVTPGTTVTIQWEVNGILYGTNNYTGRDFSAAGLSVGFQQQPTVGDYRVHLLVNGKEKKSFEFTIKPDS